MTKVVGIVDFLAAEWARALSDEPRTLGIRPFSEGRPPRSLVGSLLAIRMVMPDTFARWAAPAVARASASAPASTRVAGTAAAASSVVAGISGARRNAAAAVLVNGELRAFCEQERITRVRRQGLTGGALPTPALDAALRSAGGFGPSDVRTYVTAEESVWLPADRPSVRIDHHQAHAAAAFGLSGHDSAAVLVCDRHGAPQVSVWVGTPGRLTDQHWPDSGPGFAGLFAECTRLFGLGAGQEHELEALARLDRGGEASRLRDVMTYRDGTLWISPRWRASVADWLAEPASDSLRLRARVASAVQRHLGDLLVELGAEIRSRTGLGRLCVGGGLFYNTYFTTRLRESGVFDDVFVGPNPGNAGAAIGAALTACGEHAARPTSMVSPFLGPQYDAEDIKRTLDNCKLSYDCLDDREMVDVAVDALVHGQLVGWFQGRMEWGHRALGNRSILASPLSPYVLDNLNVFLKHRPQQRAYGLSVRQEDAGRFFAGPSVSRFMEYEYRPLDLDRLRSVMPEGIQTLRVQTISDAATEPSLDRFRRLHEAFGQATGVPVLVNTSFNGFAEPMVCSPRDAVRVFYGTGLDLLMIDRFVLRK